MHIIVFLCDDLLFTARIVLDRFLNDVCQASDFVSVQLYGIIFSVLHGDKLLIAQHSYYNVLVPGHRYFVIDHAGYNISAFVVYINVYRAEYADCSGALINPRHYIIFFCDDLGKVDWEVMIKKVQR